jgi:hypothetical protein
MARKRKTVEVEALRKRINLMLADPQSGSETRTALARVLEGVLMDTNNYKGFGYVKWLGPQGCAKWEADGRPTEMAPYIGDETMRVYW